MSSEEASNRGLRGITHEAAVGLLAIVLAGATGVQASESVAPEAPSFELAKGTNEIGLWGGGASSVSTIGGLDRVETEGRRVGLLSFRYGRVLLRRKMFALEYFAGGSETGAVPLRLGLGCVHRFRLRARLVLAVSPFPAPAQSNRACGFPAHGSPVRFTPGVMGRITLAALSDVAHG